MPLSPILLDALNPGPMTGRGNNTYLLPGGDGSATLVDAGVGRPEHLDAIDNALRSSGAALTSVLVTHGHPDHASGAPHLAARHPGAAFRKHARPDGDEQYGVPWLPLHDGDLVQIGADRLTVLHTPGHAPDHVAFWQEQTGNMFTGDLVVLGSSVMIDTSGGGNLEEYLASLERLLALEPRRLFPGHGPVVEDPGALLRASLGHRRLREEQVLARLAAGPATAESIADSIYDGVAPELMWAARENVRAHLHKLKHEGRATADSNGRWRRNG